MESVEVTQLLQAVRQGTPGASSRLVDAAHAELRRMAEGKLRVERADHTLQPTALVNEAFLRLCGNVADLEDRAHFLGAAAKAMERVLVDHAREKLTQKRGAGAARVTLYDLEVSAPADANLDVLAVHEALTALEEESPEFASVVRYRYFVGLTLEQIAEIDGVSVATLKRRWTFARAWLYERLDA